MADEAHNDHKEINARLEKIKNILLVLSGKGGVGKSTVAVNIAAELAQQDKKVGLLDIDIHGPSIPGMFGRDEERIMYNGGAIQPVAYSQNLSLLSVGFLIENKNDAVIWRGPLKYNIIKQFLSDVQWGDLDYLIVDSPPGTGDEPLSISQIIGKRAEAIIVTTPQRVSIDDVRKSVTFCRKLGMNIAGIVENMSGYVCPHCNTAVDIFDSGGGEKLSAETDIPFLGRVPIDPNVVRTCDEGIPLVVSDPNSVPAAEFKKIAKIIMGGENVKHNITGDSPVKKGSTMRIAIPLAEGKLAMHFGHCGQFSIIDTDETGNIIAKEEVTPPMHEPGVLPSWLHKRGATLIIAGGMGSRAQQLFKDNGIDVLVGASQLTPEELVKMYADGTLVSGENVCDH